MPHFTSFRDHYHLIWTTNEPNVLLPSNDNNRIRDFDLVDVMSEGNSDNPYLTNRTLRINPNTAADQPLWNDMKPSKPVECNRRLWVVWNSFFKDSVTGVTDGSRSFLKAAWFSDGLWNVELIGYPPSASLVHALKDVYCVADTLYVTLCVGDELSVDAALHCDIKLVHRNLTNLNSSWLTSSTGITTYAQDLAVANNEHFAFLAWVGRDDYIYYSWTPVSDMTKWDPPRVIEGIANEPLHSEEPSFACSSTTCYLTYLVGGKMSRIVKFVTCQDVVTKPCIDNNEAVFHLPPPNMVRPPVVVIRETTQTRDESYAVVVVVISIWVILFVLSALVVGLMARNKSGCFAPIEYIRVPVGPRTANGSPVEPTDTERENVPGSPNETTGDGGAGGGGGAGTGTGAGAGAGAGEESTSDLEVNLDAS
eukprot:TRINITY_DN2685_c0_g1_i16.p1 TRINITY_DN2685_c0_g1~~TRINITY_DN2685_c0_g1_i16.p1  ORF type:complete len:423 (-),score=78.16 TRINITY_DN2685_c0_g1_i16:127-1395(-)